MFTFLCMYYKCILKYKNKVNKKLKSSKKNEKEKYVKQIKKIIYFAEIFVCDFVQLISNSI